MKISRTSSKAPEYYQKTSEQCSTTVDTEDLNKEKSSTTNSELPKEVNIDDSLLDSAVKLELSTEGLTKSQILNLAKQSDFEKDIIQLPNTYKKIAMPEYSGIYSADKAIAVAIENLDVEKKSFVYGIISGNFLIPNSNDMTEEERQANIKLGMEKANEAANNFISEENKQDFLDAMKTIANLAVNGKVTSEGEMDYGIYKGRYLGSGSNLVQVDNEIELLKKYNPKGYKTYSNIKKEADSFNYLLESSKNYYEIAKKDNQEYLEKNKIIYKKTSSD